MYRFDAMRCLRWAGEQLRKGSRVTIVVGKFEPPLNPEPTPTPTDTPTPEPTP